MVEALVRVIHLMEMAVHQEPEAALVAHLSTLPVAMAQRMAAVVRPQTGAAVAVAVQQLLAQLQPAVAVTEVQVVHLPSQEQASRSQAVAVAVAVIAATQATPLLLAAMAAQVVAATVVPRHGTEAPALQAPVLAALSTQVVAAVAAAIALAPKSLETTTAVAVAVVRESLSCAISCLPLRLPTLIADQTLVRPQLTTSRETKPSRLQAMHL
jgi:hypothetical protein